MASVITMTDAHIPEPEPAPGDPQNGGRPAPSVTTAVPPTCPTRTRMYRCGSLAAEGFPAQQISELLDAHPDAVVWLDLFDPDLADLGIVIQEFGLHPLAVEDAIQDHQRPKLDRYPTHLFGDMYAVEFDAATGRLVTAEISAFITPRALITVRKSAFDVDALIRRWDTAVPEVSSGGVGALLYGLVDAVVDGHYAAVEQLDDAIDELEDALFEDRPTDIRRRGFELRKSLVQLRRVITPMREVVGRMLRNDWEVQLVAEPLVPYYQDVFDHVTRSVEGVETSRDLLNSILETNLNEQSNQLNDITKKLAAWAAIIAVPTAVTGFYGQNVPYPGFGHHNGFVTSCVVIVLLAGGIWAMLRRRGWL
jgi:magnesium transporter